MSFTKKLLTAVLLISSTAALAAPTAGPEFKLGLTWDKAGKTDNWDGGVGVAAQALFWHNKSFAFAATLGTSKWDSNTDTKTFSDGISGELKGDARLNYLGISGIQVFPFQDNLSAELEAGMRVVSVSSNVKLSYTDGTTTATDKLEFGTAFTGIIAGDLLMKLNAQTKLFGGVGYQFDVTKARGKAFDAYDNNSLASAFIRAGVQFSY